MRVDQGVPKTRSSAKQKTKPAELKPEISVEVPAQSPTQIVSRVELLLEQILEKLEEIRYGLTDNETGISNLLRQMKITNKQLDELIDKRH